MKAKAVGWAFMGVVGTLLAIITLLDRKDYVSVAGILIAWSLALFHKRKN